MRARCAQGSHEQPKRALVAAFSASRSLWSYSTPSAGAGAPMLACATRECSVSRCGKCARARAAAALRVRIVCCTAARRAIAAASRQAREHKRAWRLPSACGGCSGTRLGRHGVRVRGERAVRRARERREVAGRGTECRSAARRDAGNGRGAQQAQADTGGRPARQARVHATAAAEQCARQALRRGDGGSAVALTWRASCDGRRHARSHGCKLHLLHRCAMHVHHAAMRCMRRQQRAQPPRSRTTAVSVAQCASAARSAAPP